MLVRSKQSLFISDNKKVSPKSNTALVLKTAYYFITVWVFSNFPIL